MTTTKIADAYIESGWCKRCGYKRSAHGNCPNCDHWYTHPLLTIGGSLAVSVLLLMTVGIRSLRDADPNFERFSKGLLTAAPMPAFVDPFPATRPVAPPVYFTATTPHSGVLPPLPPPTSERQLGKLEDLCSDVHAAEQAYKGAVSQDAPLRRANQMVQVSATINRL